MIRRLTERDHETCIALISKRPAENLFIIGDIEAYGYDQPFQQLWGDFADDGQLRAVLLNYEGNYIPYAESQFNAEGFAAIIKTDQNSIMLSGLLQVTSQMTPFFDR